VIENDDEWIIETQEDIIGNGNENQHIVNLERVDHGMTFIGDDRAIQMESRPKRMTRVGKGDHPVRWGKSH